MLAKTNLSDCFEFAEKVNSETYIRVSMFEGHSLQPVNTDVLPIPDLFSGWIFVVLFFCFVLFVWLLSFSIKRIMQIVGAFFGNRGFTRLTKDGNVFSEPLFLPFLMLMMLCLSLFAFRVGMLFGFWNILGVETLITFGQVVIGVGMLYLLKVVIIKITAWIFKEQVAASLYLLNLFVFNANLTLIFLPFLLVAFFGYSWLQTSAVYLMLLIFAGWYVWRAIRSFLEIISVTKFSHVHNFLYLCTLEIGYYLLVYVFLSQI
jgi:hypothetical protein